MKFFAEVILPLPLHDVFTYEIPEHLVTKVACGKRVIVQFGKKKQYSGLVTSMHPNEPTGFEIKKIHSVPDDDPVIFPVNLALWRWMAEYYMAPLGDVMKAALPSGLKLESNSVISLISKAANFTPTPQEQTIIELLKIHPLAIQELEKKSGHDFSFKVIQQLINKKIIQAEEEVGRKFKPKTRILVEIHPNINSDEKWMEALGSLKKAARQHELLEHFAAKIALFTADQKPAITKKKLFEDTVFSDAILNQLISKKILQLKLENVSRLETEIPVQTGLNLLNTDQHEALLQIKKQFTEKQVVLIHGVTASGKTEIYIHLMEEACRQGKQVLYLVPEISLTTQIVSRLKKVFGNGTGVYHSKMNDAERVETWNKVLAFSSDPQHSYQVVLGARSAVFLPFQNLGLIIVDEEHENSYKQFDPSPRYNARDMAVIMGAMHKAPVLLGSATPSFESYFNAKTGKYGLVNLLSRHGNAKLPQILVADIIRAYKRRQMRSVLTPELFEKIETALSNHEQIILFQNRRGYSPFVECMNCGHIPQCENCDVSLTYHKKIQHLNCHYCGFRTAMPQHCAKCGSPEIKTRGFGTEKIEDEIKQLFPAARIARMDLDTTHSRFAVEKIIYQLEEQKIDIVIGTQMVTKGLDFEHVSVVGILNADNLLNYPDFRAFERAFQLMLQVSGRSGRKNKQGTVVIQTSQPDHNVIKLVQEHDFDGLFNLLMPERKLFSYPPWFRLIKISIKHKNAEHLERAADIVSKNLKALGKFKVLGPEYPLVSRVQLWFIKEIWVKVGKDRNLPETRNEIKKAIENAQNQPNMSGAIIQVDVDSM